MKKQLLIAVCLLFCTAGVNAQSTNKAANSYSNDTFYSASNSKATDSGYSYTGPVSYYTSKRDTLYLTNDDLGHLIAQVWDTDKHVKQKPVIVFATREAIASKNSKVPVLQPKIKN